MVWPRTIARARTEDNTSRPRIVRASGSLWSHVPDVSTNGVNIYTQQAFGRLRKAVIAKTGISFKWKDFRATGGQLAIDSGVSIEQVSRSMRHASVVTTERYYCRARADLAYARVNDAYNSVFVREPAITGKPV